MLPNGSCRRIVVFLLSLGGLAAVAVAGPVNPAHRLEDLNVPALAPADILHVPGTSRAILFSRSGEVRELVADRLLDVVIASIPAETSCGAHGVLSATWDPLAPGSVAFVSYTAARNSALSIGQLDLATGAFTEIYTQGFAAACTDIGGGLAFAADGALILGVGDMGQPSRAAQTTSNVGKIYRLGRNGRVPTAPLSPNPLPTLPVYGTGVRDPVRITSVGSDTWFLDAGPSGGQDELNLVVSLGNYGWSSALLSGYQLTTGIEDPHAALPAAGVSGLDAWQGSALGPSIDGSLMVSTRGSGEIMSIRPNLADRAAPTIRSLFVRGAGDPAGFELLRQFPDGFAHVVSSEGRWLRLAPRGGVPDEPAGRESIVPLSVRKRGTEIEIAVERMPGAADVGLYVGNVMTLASSGYSHAGQPPTWHSVDGATSDALVRITAGPTELGSASYILASSRRDCLESGLGSGDAGERPRPVLGCSVDVLGGGTHSVANVDVTVMSMPAAMLNLPRDLAFHPDAQDELWVVNQGSHSVSIFHDAGMPTQWWTNDMGPNGEHFLAQPSALAFGPGTPFFATAHEEDDYTQGPPPGGTPMDFMGPTLWTSDSAVFEGGHLSHYDMLHNSPNAVGIAWDSNNRYWVYDGYHRSLTRYDFSSDHGPGGSDHSDGVIRRFVDGEVGYAPNISSHVIVHPVTGMVYAADTANARIVMLDPTTGIEGAALSPNYDGCSQRVVDGATLTTIVDGSLYGLVAPSGLELSDNMLFVSDNATSRILAFDLSGVLIDYLETGFPAGTLQGMAFDPRDGSLWVVDTLAGRVLRIAAP